MSHLLLNTPQGFRWNSGFSGVTLATKLHFSELGKPSVIEGWYSRPTGRVTLSMPECSRGLGPYK